MSNSGRSPGPLSKCQIPAHRLTRVKFSASPGPPLVSNSRRSPGPPRVKFSAFSGPPSCQILGVLADSALCVKFSAVSGPPRVKFAKKRSSLLSFDGRPTTSCQIFGGLRAPVSNSTKKRSSLLSFDDRPATLCQIFASQDDICQSVKVCQILTDLRTPTIPVLRDDLPRRRAGACMV